METYVPKKTNPALTPLLCFCVSPSLFTVKLDCDSLLPLSLVSLSRNRNRRTADPQVSVGDLIWNLSSTSWWSSICAFISVYGSVGCGMCGCMLVFMYSIFVNLWLSQRNNAWPCKNSMLYFSGSPHYADSPLIICAINMLHGVMRTYTVLQKMFVPCYWSCFDLDLFSLHSESTV